MESPPKRVTRARAAAKGKAPEKEKDTTIKVTTAAAKARATRAAKTEVATVPAAAPVTRRRTRAATEEEEDNKEEAQQEMPEPKASRTTRGRTTRGRKMEEPEEDTKMEDVQEEPEAAPVVNTRAKRVVKKATDEHAALPTRPAPAPRITTRGRARKVETPTEEPAQAAPEPPQRTVRTRKAEAPVEEPAPVVEAPKRGLRRAATVTKAPAAAAPKKSVKFEVEPDKENDVPPVATRGRRAAAPPAAKPETATGLKAKPVRKPAAARTTRGAATTSKAVEKPAEEPTPLEKSPLSPKKATQIATAKPQEKEDSDDELGDMSKTPMRPIEKSPIKPPASLMSAAKKLDFTTSAPNITVNRVMAENPQLGSSLLASPARKMPASPWKGAIKDSPIKPPTFGESLLRSPKKLGEGFSNSPFKSSMAPPSRTPSFKQSLLQSPARRPPSPVKISAGGSPTRSPTRQPFGGRSLATPKPSTFSISRFGTPKTLVKNAFRPERVPMSSQRPQTEAKPQQEIKDLDFADVKAFSGRLSSVLPRYADPVMREDAGLSPMGKGAATETQAETSQAVVLDEQQQSEDVDMPDSPQVEQHLEEEPAESSTQPRLSTIAEGSQSTTPQGTPPSFHTMRPEEDLDNSDSEDELATGSPVFAVKMSSNEFKALNSSPVKKLDFGLKSPALGFTPLSKQLSSWQAPTPRPQAEVDAEVETELEAMEVADNAATAGLPRVDSMNSVGTNDSVAMIETPMDSPQAAVPQQVVPSPAPSASAAPVASFFDDEMMIRDDEEVEAELDGMAGEEILLEIEGLDALEMAPEEDEMDQAFAAEADELSMIQEEHGLDDEEMDELVYQADQNEDLIQQEAVMDGMEIAEDPVDAPVTDFNASIESAVSEASQEYGDENVAPGEAHLEPVVMGPPATPVAMTPLGETPRSRIPTTAGSRRQSMPRATPTAQAVRRSSRPFTPSRAVIEQRTVHTVSKVPLKPAAAESPVKLSPRKRPATVARLPAPRNANVGTPSGLRNVRSVSSPTVTTPTPRAGSLTAGNYAESEWSSLATPAKTPRPPGYDKVLKGATVFVDVHTSEGADASAVFIDLLSQMGAKCLKQWNWNPSTSPLSSANSSLNSNPDDMDTEIGAMSKADEKKIGITHVVFKDGSKRTMEKVRDAKGAVTCVGVGWVLDCEREGRWVGEEEYKVDTAFVPRGGARRRKSMEPRALANLNGTLVDTPKAGNGKETHKYPATEKPKKIGRRESTQWIRTPQPQGSRSMMDDDTPSTNFGETPRAGPTRYSMGGSVIDRDGDVDMYDYTLAELSPLPATPNTAEVQRYSEHILDGVEQTPFPPTAKKVEDEKKKLLMTAPAKRAEKPTLGELGVAKRGEMGGVGGADSQALMMRLLAARRKSLQWAPKVGSPLSRMN